MSHKNAEVKRLSIKLSNNNNNKTSNISQNFTKTENKDNNNMKTILKNRKEKIILNNTIKNQNSLQMDKD